LSLWFPLGGEPSLASLRLWAAAALLALLALPGVAGLAAAAYGESEEYAVVSGERVPLGGGLSLFVSARPLEGPQPLLSSTGLLGALQAAGGGDPVAFGRNVLVTQDGGIPYENEPSVAVNPLDPNNAVLAAHHMLVGDKLVAIGVYWTMDGGVTWEGPVFLPVSQASDLGHSDPAAAASPNGVFYVAYLSVGPKTVDGYRLWLSSDIMLAVSRDGGVTWEASKVVGPEYLDLGELANQGLYVYSVLLDKEYIAVGRDPATGNDIVVVTFSEFIQAYDSRLGEQVETVRIMAMISRDGGATWEGPFQVSEKINITAGDVIRVIQGSNPAVAPDGTIYVAAYYSGDDGWLEGSAEIVVYRSRDYGATWEGPFTAAILPGEMPYNHPKADFRFWSSMFPSMDVAPDGTIYIVYAADPDGPGGDPGDVFLVYSTDGGETWSEPIRVNDDEPGNIQFFPWLDVDSEGVVHIIWGDSRNDPQGVSFDVYYARYTPGEGLEPNVRVSDYTNNPLMGYGFQGDYFNVAAEGGKVYVAWTDNRGGFREMGGLLWRGVDQSIAVAVSGEPVKPAATVEGVLIARASAAVAVRGEMLPVRAAFTLLIDGAPLKAGSFNMPLFSDDAGMLEATLLLPPLSPGEHEIAIANYFTGEPVASMTIVVEDDITVGVEAAVKAAVEETIAGLTESLAALDGRLAAVEEAVAAVRSDVQAVAAGVEEVRLTVAAISEAIARLEEGQAAIAAKLDEVAQRQEAVEQEVNMVSEKLDEVTGRIDALEERVAALEEALAEAQGAAGEAGTWAKASAALAALAVGGVAFIAFTALRGRT